MNNQSLISRSGTKLVVGLGKTGLAVVDYLKKNGFAFKVADTREAPPNLAFFKEKWPGIPLHLGSIPQQWCDEVEEIIVSPGVSADREEFVAAKAKGVSVIGDISLFLRTCTAPIIAVTGSNGKSTLVDLLGCIARDLGLKAQVLGNIGVPAISAARAEMDLIILELSSFQLELIELLNAKVAMIMNISADHMDRYENIQAYWLAKQRIYQGAEIAIYNRTDPLTVPKSFKGERIIRYGLGAPDLNDFGILQLDNKPQFAHGVRVLHPAGTLKIKGEHNVSNGLAALAVAEAMSWPMEKVLHSLTQYSGLPYRCQWVATHNDVHWYNDSKATNVGSSIAAITGLKQTNNRLIWVAGGDAKGADFTELAAIVKAHVGYAYLFGRDRVRIAQALDAQGFHDFEAHENLEHLFVAMRHILKLGDLVLFSPACASFDQYQSFEHRGEAFNQLVEQTTLGQ